MTSTEITPVFFQSRGEFRDWLQKHHDRFDSLWVGFHKKASGVKGISYADAVDEALCFGWIDGIRKSLDDSAYVNRFTPRRPGSNWSQVNIKRVSELIELGLMTPAGLAAFEKRKPPPAGTYSYENRPESLDEPYASRFRENDRAWQFFQAQPPGYRRSAIWWVVSAKREETRLRRLERLIADSEAGKRLDMLSPGKSAS